jgi:hypothetical protein
VRWMAAGGTHRRHVLAQQVVGRSSEARVHSHGAEVALVVHQGTRCKVRAARHHERSHARDHGQGRHLDMHRSGQRDRRLVEHLDKSQEGLRGRHWQMQRGRHQAGQGGTRWRHAAPHQGRRCAQMKLHSSEIQQAVVGWDNLAA